MWRHCPFRIHGQSADLRDTDVMPHMSMMDRSHLILEFNMLQVRPTGCRLQLARSFPYTDVQDSTNRRDAQHPSYDSWIPINDSPQIPQVPQIPHPLIPHNPQNPASPHPHLASLYTSPTAPAHTLRSHELPKRSSKRLAEWKLPSQLSALLVISASRKVRDTTPTCTLHSSARTHAAPRSVTHCS
jgi:hypothetical protein